MKGTLAAAFGLVLTAGLGTKAIACPGFNIDVISVEACQDGVTATIAGNVVFQARYGYYNAYVDHVMFSVPFGGTAARIRVHRRHTDDPNEPPGWREDGDIMWTVAWWNPTAHEECVQYDYSNLNGRCWDWEPSWRFLYSN